MENWRKFRRKTIAEFADRGHLRSRASYLHQIEDENIVINIDNHLGSQVELWLKQLDMPNRDHREAPIGAFDQTPDCESGRFAGDCNSIFDAGVPTSDQVEPRIAQSANSGEFRGDSTFSLRSNLDAPNRHYCNPMFYEPHIQDWRECEPSSRRVLIPPGRYLLTVKGNSLLSSRTKATRQQVARDVATHSVRGQTQDINSVLTAVELDIRAGRGPSRERTLKIGYEFQEITTTAGPPGTSGADAETAHHRGSSFSFRKLPVIRAWLFQQ